MTWLRRTTLGVALALALLVPATAHAVTVECSSPFGTCEVSNDGMDDVSCSCGGGGTTGTGGMMWAGLDEAELLAVCLDQLDVCGEFATESATTTFGTDTIEDTSVGVTTDTSDTGGPTTGPTEATTDETESMTTVDPSDSTTGTSADATGSTSDSSASGDTEGSSSTGDDPSSGSTDPSTSGTPMTMSGTETAPVETSDAESSGDTGGSDGDGGCSCSTDGAPDPIVALGVLALFGLRLRRRR
jgi:MYXO-CTERM domain-containing protein